MQGDTKYGNFYPVRRPGRSQAGILARRKYEVSRRHRGDGRRRKFRRSLRHVEEGASSLAQIEIGVALQGDTGAVPLEKGCAAARIRAAGIFEKTAARYLAIADLMFGRHRLAFSYFLREDESR